MNTFAAVLLAAGQSRRMQGAVSDKILTSLSGRSVFFYSVEAFLRSEVTNHFVVVHRNSEQRREMESSLNYLSFSEFGAAATFDWVTGGAERQDSVFNGIAALPLTIDYVYIHDCARPLIAPAMLAELRAAVMSDKAVVLAHRVTDTIKELPGDAKDTRRLHLSTLDRSRLWAMETPQVFDRELIIEAYRKVRLNSLRVTDDAAAAELSGHPVSLLENRFPNPKITTPGDLAYLEFLLKSRAQS